MLNDCRSVDYNEDQVPKSLKKWCDANLSEEEVSTLHKATNFFSSDYHFMSHYRLEEAHEILGTIESMLPRSELTYNINSLIQELQMAMNKVKRVSASLKALTDHRIKDKENEND